MTHDTLQVVFFDIGDTLGKVKELPPGTPHSGPTLHLDLFPGINNILEKLDLHHLRVGVISRIFNYTPTMVNQMLSNAGILSLFDQALLHYIPGEKPKDKMEFMNALEKAQVSDAGLCIFVGEDQQERENAKLAGMLVAASLQDVESRIP